MYDGQWSITYGDVSYVFGTPDVGLYLAAAPDLGTVDIVTDDTDRPREDGRAFGQDFLGGRTITFDLNSDESRAADPKGAVLDRIGEAARVWRADEVREKAGALAELRARLGGRTRVAFGRPRRFAPSLQYAPQGVAVVLADFACADDLFYSDEENALVVGLVPPPSAGLLAPLAAPLATAQASGSAPGAIVVAGDAASWPVMTVHGPITNPTIDVVGLWKITLRTTLAYDESVTIDTRPWSRQIVRSSGGSLAGALTRDSVRITRAKVPPGHFQVVLRGTDPTATSSLRFAWRDAYTTL